jgi:hypothetical protein
MEGVPANRSVRGFYHERPWGVCLLQNLSPGSYVFDPYDFSYGDFEVMVFHRVDRDLLYNSNRDA